MVETTCLATAIAYMVFDVIPIICMMAGLGSLIGCFHYPELDDELTDDIQQEEVIYVDSVDSLPPVNQKEEPFSYDSLQCLFDDMEMHKIELSVISYHNGLPVVILEDDSCFNQVDTLDNTLVDIEAISSEEVDIEKMVSDILTPSDWIPAGSDESCFFIPTTWDDNYYDNDYYDTQVECPAERITLAM